MQIIQGNTKRFKLTVYDLDGVAVDLSTAAILIELWQKGAQVASITKTEASGDVDPGVDGVLTVYFSETDTELALGEYVLEARVTADLSGVTYRVSMLAQVTVDDAPTYNGLGQ